MWCGRQDLNLGPLAYQASALPLSYGRSIETDAIGHIPMFGNKKATRVTPAITIHRDGSYWWL